MSLVQLRPSINIRKRVDELESHGKQDYQNIKELQELNKAQCKLLLAMIDHMIDGNHVDKMKKTRDNIIDIIVNE